ncbi:MAG: hypothetical protein HY897_03760 [Deltaproteobacteria bacterium]|nr:hypothetical protein [Deltaproteobacteria bacterium]
MDYSENILAAAKEFVKRRFFAILIGADLVLALLLIRSYMAPDCQEGAVLLHSFVVQQMHGDISDTYIACAGSEKVYSVEAKAFFSRETVARACAEKGCGLWTQGNTRRKRDICYCLRVPDGDTTVLSTRRCHKVVFKDILGYWQIDAVDPCDAPRDFCCRM